MLKKQQELQEFLSTFAFLKNEAVILYGTGQYTELLVRSPLPFRVIGLMDRRKTGTFCCGLPVLSEEEVRRSGCRYMILAANLSSVPAICRRIESFVRTCGITVYCMNGRRPLEELGEVSLPPDWVRGVEELLAETEQYDVVSFDLFDTLIVRRCLLPERVFSLVERRAREAGLPLPEDFVSRRQAAERVLYHGGHPWYYLDDIYRWLEKANQLRPGAADQLQQLELAAELDMAQPRPDMVRLYRRLLADGKRTIITTDMYLTDEQLRPLLKKCGLAGAEVYVSCKCGGSKHLGTLFQVLRERFPGQRILHIGDNPRCDVENARKNEIGGALIPSAAAWAETLRIPGEPDSCMYTLFAQRCFSSAFPLDGARKRIQIDSPEDMGYLFFGPLAAGYLAWLIDQVRKHKIDHILFVSRDGWLFYQLYQKLRQQCNNLPEASYFLTSRRCAGIASIKTEADAYFIFEEVCYNRGMRIGEMLEKVYGIAGDLEPMAEYTVGELGTEKSWMCVQRHMKHILEHAALERTGYQRYIATQISHCSNPGMMNFVGRGVTQRCLQNILGQKLSGFYFALEYDAAYILGEKASVFSWYPEPLSTHTGKSALAEQLLLGETIFSAPCGAVVSFSDSGKPIYEQTKRERVELINACHRGIEAYVGDILQIRGNIDGLADTVNLADAIFGLLGHGPFVPSRDIKVGLQEEDRFQ